MSESLPFLEQMPEQRTLRGFERAIYKHRLKRLMRAAAKISDDTRFEDKDKTVIVDGEPSDGYQVYIWQDEEEAQTDIIVRVEYDDTDGHSIARITADRKHTHQCGLESLRTFDSTLHPDQNDFTVKEVLDEMSFVARLSDGRELVTMPEMPDIASIEHS